MPLTFDITMSLDGYVTGPDVGRENPLGVGGEAIHEWMFGLRTWREGHGEAGGEAGPDDAVAAEWFERPGAYIMGRGMFSNESGPWGPEPWEGWWGDDPPYHAPVYVLTHHARAPLPKEGGTTFHFVTDGIESALEQARAAAGEKDVAIAGGADVARQYLDAGHLDELQIHLVPLLLGGGTRLFEERPEALGLEIDRVVAGEQVTHLRYRPRR